MPTGEEHIRRWHNLAARKAMRRHRLTIIAEAPLKARDAVDKALAACTQADAADLARIVQTAKGDWRRSAIRTRLEALTPPGQTRKDTP